MSYECDVSGNVLQMQVIGFAKKVAQLYENSNLIGQTTTISRAAIMQDPFACIVAGCTQSGKTVWEKTHLENAQKICKSSSLTYHLVL